MVVIYFTAVNDRIKENLIRNIFESALLTALHPRTAINIIIQEMQDCGGVSSKLRSCVREVIDWPEVDFHG